MFTNSMILALAATVSAVPTTLAPYSNSTSNSTSNGTTNSTTGAYKLIADYSGNTFFDYFTAFAGPDPTHGHVQYQTLKAAADQELIGHIYNSTSNTSIAYIGVDSKSQAPNGRNSVRLTSKQTFNAGSLLAIDVRHAPSQYGVWPAIWLLGSEGTWPESGESDILEYVHEDNYNGMTLHTSPGCLVSNVSTSHQQGRLLSNDCNKGNGATGCSVAAYDQNRLAGGNNTKTFATAGSKFNAQKGGVYVHDWQEDGITVWMFPRAHLPADLVEGHPEPKTWKQTPLAKFSGPGCDFSSSFRSMQLIINIDFCGDWAGKVWEESGAANATGVETCNEYVEKNPEVFEESFFEIGGVQVYTSNGQKPGQGQLFDKRDEKVVAIKNVTRPHCKEGMEETMLVEDELEMPKHHNCSNGTHHHHQGYSRHGNLTLRDVKLPIYPGHMDTHSGASSLEVMGWLFAAGVLMGVAFVA